MVDGCWSMGDVCRFTVDGRWAMGEGRWAVGVVFAVSCALIDA